MVAVDQEKLWRILAAVAKRKALITYLELTDAYFKATGDVVPYHLEGGGSGWSEPLRLITLGCHANGDPPLSALVILDDTKMPGYGFWGLPGTPKKIDHLEWAMIVKKVHAHKYTWERA